MGYYYVKIKNIYFFYILVILSDKTIELLLYLCWKK